MIKKLLTAVVLVPLCLILFLSGWDSCHPGRHSRPILRPWREMAALSITVNYPNSMAAASWP